jgi:nucleoside-diphosphate-sugar epimerase/glycosyltransferase involved in cell wall biosynthesis
MAAGERSERDGRHRVTSDAATPLERLAGRKLLVLGGSGFVGRHVCRVAAEAGATVTATHRHVLRDDVRRDDVRYVRVDVTSDDLSSISGHETAVWCIGRSDHREAWTDPAGDLQANAVALARFLEVFRGKLVLVSSGAVYHGLKGPVGPGAALAPLHPYAISKLAAERLALANASARLLSGLVVLRLFHPFGPGERQTRLVPRLLKQFVSDGEQHFRLRGDGRTLMDVQPIDSVAKAAAAAATVDGEGLVLDVCRGGGRRLVDVVGEIAQALEIDPTIETDAAASEEIVEFEPDPRPARALLGLPADDDLGPAVREYAELFRPERLHQAVARTKAAAERAAGNGTASVARGDRVDVSLIIPCLNEDQNVAALVDKLVRLMDEANLRREILIVDDCSDDYTFREALMLSVRYPEVVALHKGLPRGIGNAIRFGLDHAVGRTGVIVMGDNVDPLAAIPDFHRLVAEERYDLVLLNRHASPEHRKSIPLWPYRVYQWIFRTLCRVGSGLPHRDPTYAYRGFSIDFVRSLELESGGFEISPEITLKSWLRGARIGELTGAQGRRVAGASNFVFSQQALGFFRVLVKATFARRFGWARRLGIGRGASWIWQPRGAAENHERGPASEPEQDRRQDRARA